MAPVLMMNMDPGALDMRRPRIEVRGFAYPSAAGRPTRVSGWWTVSSPPAPMRDPGRKRCAPFLLMCPDCVQTRLCRKYSFHLFPPPFCRKHGLQLLQQCTLKYHTVVLLLSVDWIYGRTCCCSHNKELPQNNHYFSMSLLSRKYVTSLV